MVTLEKKALDGTATREEQETLRKMQKEQVNQKDSQDLKTRQSELNKLLVEGKIDEDQMNELGDITDKLNGVDRRTEEQKMYDQLDEISQRVVENGNFDAKDLAQFLELQGQLGNMAPAKNIESMNKAFMKKLFSQDTLNSLINTEQPMAYTKHTLELIQQFAALSKGEEIIANQITQILEVTTQERQEAEYLHRSLTKDSGDERHAQVAQLEGRLAMRYDQLAQLMERHDEVGPDYQETSQQLLIRMGFDKTPPWLEVVLASMKAIGKRMKREVKYGAKGTASAYDEAQKRFGRDLRW